MNYETQLLSDSAVIIDEDESRRRRKRLLLIAGGAAVLLVAVAAWISMRGDKAATPDTPAPAPVVTVLRPGQSVVARTVTAWASGFIAMELAGQFRFDGDVDHAFEFGVDRLADALDR